VRGRERERKKEKKKENRKKIERRKEGKERKRRKEGKRQRGKEGKKQKKRKKITQSTITNNTHNFLVTNPRHHTPKLEMTHALSSPFSLVTLAKAIQLDNLPLDSKIQGQSMLGNRARILRRRIGDRDTSLLCSNKIKAIAAGA
jgi:hypothetical protein